MFETSATETLQAQTRAAQEVLAELTLGSGRCGETDLAGWVDLVGAVQELVNVATAVQTYAIARVAAREDVEGEDGTVGERDMGLGYARMDAPGLVGDVLGLTEQGAVGRVSTAVALTSRMPWVLEAMAAGRLDGWRASVVADELGQASAEVAAQVAATVEPHLGGEPAGRLRARVRRALNAVDPDLVRTRAEQARLDRELRRFVEQVGTDTWIARIPVEQSRPAFAVIDELARRYRAERGLTLGQARVDAMVDLIAGRATGVFQVTLAVPAEDFADTEHPVTDAGHPDLVAVTGFGTPGETLVRRSWLAALAGASTTTPAGGRELPVRAVRPKATPSNAGAKSTQIAVVGCDAVTGALVTPVRDTESGRTTRLSTTAYPPTAAIRAHVTSRDGRCRFPGCQVSARFCDLDHVIPWTDPAAPPSGGKVGRTEPSNLICLCRRHHRTKQRRRWKVRLSSDGTVEWTTPTGRRILTQPVDHLRSSDPGLRQSLTDPSSQLIAPQDDPGDYFSWLEEHLSDQLALHEAALADAAETRRLTEERARHRALADAPPPF